MSDARKLAIINAVPYGSTGKIVRGIAGVARKKGWDALICYSWTKSLKKSNDKDVMVGSFFGKAMHMLLARLTGLNGCFSVLDTWRLIRRLKRYRPDVINLHILHNWNVNLPMLFSYIKKSGIPVIWTMHDCWAFTGQCPCFDMVKCDKWKSGCHHCAQYREYPQAYVDQTKGMWKRKKKWFSGVRNLTIVTPSVWLSGLIGQSYLAEYPVKVIRNGIDLDVFQPTESDFRAKYHLEDKKILLGVAFGWGKRKGLDVFIELARRLDESYQIVLVGTDEETDKLLPDGILSIHRTQDQHELAGIYTAADLFVNPTREDNYPTVNMEAIACGTPVLTFRTGGSPESIGDSCGAVVECDDIDGLERAARELAPKKKELSSACLDHARSFDMNDRFEEYLMECFELNGN